MNEYLVFWKREEKEKIRGTQGEEVLVSFFPKLLSW